MKPIAEIVWAGGIEGSIKDVKFYKVPSPDVGTKLYTHPVKELTELTDGELEAIRKKAWKLADDATGNCMSYSLEFQIIYDREFAREILRKASEK
ncbi:hypothetical protein UFOVP42_5 [uncultured Caudovirales phage]|uniref:Uncharacterized protein n=1 Tax=uncultured Caudovirales phage TaxID=2100421 RepID=A0A6J5KQ05_9CAUD|nr:hypothetical protein UFOVP42_5 [uncultured Caudovirales phage]